MTSSSLARALIGAVSMLAMAACSAPGGGETGPVKLLEAPVGQLPEGVTPTVYRLSLKTDPAAEGFTGAVEIDVMLDKPHARIWLHSLDQRILSAFARLPDGSQVAATFTGNQAEGGVGYFDFETPLPAGGATLVIDYEAPYNFGLAGLYKVTAGGEHYLATQMEAIDARRMVPSFDEPRFKTPWVISVTAPEGDKVISNALLLSSSPAKDGFVEHMFAPTRAIQSYLVALAVGPYDESEQLLIDYKSGMRPAPIPLRGFAAKGKGAKLGEALAITDEMLLWQEDYFGQAYPYGKLDLIAAPDFAYGAMENAGAIIYRESALLIDERTTLQQRRSIFSTHAHELAHQWFGNLVTPKWWDDIWLNEAFATWMASKTMHAIDAGGEWNLNPIAGGLGAMGSDSLLSARQVRNPVTSNSEIEDAFDAITYQKGGSVLNMFETYLGEEKFREGIRVHMRRFSDGVADADDFMASLAEGSGNEAVTDSFRTFISQPGIPMLDVAVTCSGTTASMTLEQSRYAPLGSEIDRQGSTWQVPFSARVQTGETSTVVQQLLTGKQALIKLPACPDFVMPNAGGAGYWRYALDEASAAKLTANFAKLSPGEQMVFVDSLVSGFGAGSVSAETLLEGLEASTSGSPLATGQPFDTLRGWHARLDAAGKANLSAWIEATYAPVEARLKAKPKAKLTDREALLQASLQSLLIQYGERPAAQAALIRKAQAYIGLGRAADPRALPAEEVATAFGLAARQEGWRFIEPALAFAFASENQTERAAILRALAAHAEPRLAGELVGGAANLPLKASEIPALLQGAFSNTAATDTVWPAFKGVFDEVVVKLPEVRKPQLAAYSGSLCSKAGAADAKAFFESKAAMIPGYERALTQGLERSALCSAQIETQAPKLAAALAAR
jgi:alanyl aminopeptidase